MQGEDLSVHALISNFKEINSISHYKDKQSQHGKLNSYNVTGEKFQAHIETATVCCELSIDASIYQAKCH